MSLGHPPLRTLLTGTNQSSCRPVVAVHGATWNSVIEKIGTGVATFIILIVILTPKSDQRRARNGIGDADHRRENQKYRPHHWRISKCQVSVARKQTAVVRATAEVASKVYVNSQVQSVLLESRLLSISAARLGSTTTEPPAGVWPRRIGRCSQRVPF
jgi:hypothetical protein